MTAPIKNHTNLLKKAFSHEVVQRGQYTFQVTSGTSGETYWVFVNLDGDAPASCTCPRQDYIGSLKNGGQNFCSHVQAAIVHLLAGAGYQLTTRPANADVDNLHRKVLDLGLGDNVMITVRQDGNPKRQLRGNIVDDRTYEERLYAAAVTNAEAAGLTEYEAAVLVTA